MVEYKYIFKVAILGDASVGKTTLTYRFITGDFLQTLKSSIGTTLYSKLVEYKGDLIKLQIWDFAGEKRFRFLLLGYIEGANGVFLMYDITSSISFLHLQEWLDVVRQQEGHIPIMLIGSKLDLKKYRSVSTEEGLKAAKQFGLFSFIELSSKSGENVEIAIKQMTKILLADINKKEMIHL